jgi:outer membrane lipoprotein-sorting protein
MSSVKRVVFAVVPIVLATALAHAGTELGDPYEILAKYFEACGGLDRLKAERTQYSEGDMALGTMQGTIKLWIQKPDRSRAEIQLGPLSVTEGDNGEISWVLDTNGKLQKITKSDEATLKREEVERRMAEYEYADRESDIFTVTLEGTEQVEGTDCYVIKIANGINSDLHTYYISFDGFRLEKSTAIQGEQSADTYYGQYREIDGVLVAFYNKKIPYQTGQAYEVTFHRYESNPDIDPALFDPPEVAGKDYEFTAGDAAEDIPIEFIGNHVFIPVVVKGQERPWIIDTGAGMSVIDKAFAEEMGLELEGGMKGRGAGGTVEASFAVLPAYEIEGIRFQPQTVAVIDMGELIRRIGIDIAGILGYDFLSRFVTKVDYANEIVSFYDPGSFDYTGSGRTLDAHIKESVFEVPATLDIEHSGTWLFDLGAGVTHLDGCYALREGYTERDGVLRLGHGAGNEYQLKSVKGESMDIGGFTVYEPDICFHYGGTDTVLRTDKIGVLGNTVFRNFVLYVDYANEQVILEEGEKFNQPWPEDRSGLNIAWTVDRERVEVLYVSPDTPAEEGGFERGDILESINGDRVENQGGVIGIRELLTKEPGTRHEFVIERKGREKKLALTLADLY